MSYTVRKFVNSDADEVSALIIRTLRTTNIKDYSEEFIENDIKRRRIQEKSKNNYISIINKHIKPYFHVGRYRKNDL